MKYINVNKKKKKIQLLLWFVVLVDLSLSLCRVFFVFGNRVPLEIVAHVLVLQTIMEEILE